MDELNVYARNICIYVIYILLKFYVQKIIKYIDHLLNYIYLLYLILFVIIFVTNHYTYVQQIYFLYTSVKLISNISKY